MISPATQARFDREVAKYPADKRQSAVLACLAIVQQEQGHITPDAQQAVADYLGITAIAVREVATFYNMFNLQPNGKYKLALCTNLSCQLQGAGQALQTLQDKLGIEVGGTTPDGLFTLQQCECLGTCGDAPVLLVNDRTMCSHMSDERLVELVDGLKAADGGQA
ncbi:MAG: NAD(P)H-dependent oxidoreductase subunit E [Brachymonas sp.]|nr:NAD(P)H-dependent oxidoreductase subunit E [Brachymonas sp.]